MVSNRTFEFLIGSLSPNNQFHLQIRFASNQHVNWSLWDELEKINNGEITQFDPKMYADQINDWPDRYD
jgi:hypothetical protein